MDPRVVRHPLIASLTDDERAYVLPLVSVEERPAGHQLQRQGAPSAGLMLLLDGTVRVELELEPDTGSAEAAVPAALLGPGSWVGEQSLLAGDAHRAATATCTAVSDVVIAVVPPADAPALLEVDAVRLQLDTVARRRAATNRALRSAPIDAGTVDGRPLTLRLLWPDDWRTLAAGLATVSDETLRRRFFTLPAFTERTFRRLASVDLSSQLAWAAFVDGQPAGVGRYSRLPEDRSVAEVALLVSDAHQGRGIGPRLLAALTVGADEHGVEELLAVARADNMPVRRLLEDAGAVVAPGAEDGTVSARWSVADALAGSEHATLQARVRPVVAGVLAGVNGD